MVNGKQVVRAMPPRLLPLPDAAKALAVSLSTVGRWVARREIAVVRLGRAVRISEAELERFVKARTAPAVKAWEHA